MSSIQYRSSIHPLQFALYVSLCSITMMFAGFMSAYIVRQAAGNWLEFELPNYFTAEHCCDINKFTVYALDVTAI